MGHEKHIAYFIHNISASHMKAIIKLTLQNMGGGGGRERNNGKRGYGMKRKSKTRK